MIERIDISVDRVLKKLEELGLSDNTMVVFTTDNGGLSMPEGGDQPSSNSPFREGKGWTYEGGLRVPLIIKMP